MSLLRLLLVCCLAVGLLRSPAAAIPVFARIYGKPCHACHTVYPQLNPAGEAFRAHGLHGLTPAIEPKPLGPYLALPGAVPLALWITAGEDITHQDPPGPGSSTVTHFNLNYVSILAGGELGPYLSFLADYSPVFTDPQTGDIQYPTLLGLGFVEAHAEPAGWLGNLKLGLFELPLGTSPRVHRLSVEPYLIYATSAFRLLNRPLSVAPYSTYATSAFSLPNPPPAYGGPDAFVVNSPQIGAELSALDPDSGIDCATGVSMGTNNRIDNKGTADVFMRIGHDREAHRAGLFFYYSPDIVGDGVGDQVLRVGPDFTWYSRSFRVTSQFLAGWDSNPTGRGDSLWFYGGFVEGNYRFTPRLISLARVDYTGMPDFNDEDMGGTSHVRRRVSELTAGAQYLVWENVKLVAEVTYSYDHEAVSDTTTKGLTATLRVSAAFWPFALPAEWFETGREG